MNAQALLDSCFHGVEEGAARMYEPAEARFAGRLSAVWLEYRWYVCERGLAEVFAKWKRVSVEQCTQVEVSVLRIHLLGHSPRLSACAQRVLESGTPSPERLLDLFGADGERRECTSSEGTCITVEHWPPPSPTRLLPEEEFLALSSVLDAPQTSSEERRAAVERLCAEQSPRVVHALLVALEQHPSLAALRRLSEWGVLEALGHLEQALARLAPEETADLWTLTALQRRLQAWERIPEAAPRMSPHG